MNFDLDDPLEGLLSDGSNDSLFGNDIGNKSKKSTTKKPELKQSKMEDLFGIKTEAPKVETQKPVTAATTEKDAPALLDFSRPSISGQPSSLSSFQAKKTSTPVKKDETLVQKKEITFDDSDVLSDLGFDPKKPKSKSNILDDILGGPLITTSKEMTTKHSKGKQSMGTMKDEITANKSISRQSTETSENLQTESTIMGGYAPTGGGTRRSASRKSSTALHDPLGLFSSPLDSKRDNKAAKKSADWLGLNDDSTSNDRDPLPIPKVELEVSKPAETVKPPTPVPPPYVSNNVPKAQSIHVMNPVHVPLSNNLKPDIESGAQTMELINNETQNVLNTMQQQEFQLIIANQMRNQEQALIDMQHKQQAILQKQESQFNELLQKQIQRHNKLEEIISKQQERINSNIQAMMTQPAQIPPLVMERIELSKQTEASDVGNDEIGGMKKVELQSELKRLELEKMRMEDLISNVNANHEQELTLLEQSYRKQMGFLEESQKIMEARMKMENKSLEDFYQNKLEKLEDEKQQLVVAHQKQVKDMVETHRVTVEKMKSNYDECLKNLKSEHIEMINNIRESKMLEFSVVQENQSYMNMLKNASNYLENASGDLQQLRDTLHEQIEFAQKEKDIQLKAKEKQLEDELRILERSKEKAEEEKVRLLNLIGMLEGKLTELSKTSSEEHWAYQQKLVKLDFEKQAFEKEKKFARERMVQDERRIEELKQVQLEEHSRLIQKIQEERQLLLEEKAKIETLSKIQRKDQTNVSQAEIDAAIKVAEDATKQADAERDRLLQLQRQLETKRRELINQESNLRNKSSELDSAINSAKIKEMNADNAFKAIKRAEQNLQLKMQLVQRQFRDISVREDRLSKEKIELSKERLELQTARKRLQTTRCNLCKIGDRSREMGDYLTAIHNTESVADDRKLEANFFEMQQRELGKLDNFFDDDAERQLQNFLERNRLDNGNIVEDIDAVLENAENRDSNLDSDLLLLKFDLLRSQNLPDDGDKYV